MSKIGIGVALLSLFGDEDSQAKIAGAIGKPIAEIALVDDELVFQFSDGTKLTLYDGGQSCCEHRYMTTDDQLYNFIGAYLLGMKIVSAAEVPSYGDCHEIQFLNISTSEGLIQMKSHNEHNGYYGGFCIRAR